MRLIIIAADIGILLVVNYSNLGMENIVFSGMYSIH
jgi:hypothetical protein